MKQLQKLKAILITGTAMGFLSLTMPAVSAEKVEMEKCIGIVKPGQADGQTTIDGKKVDWILVPAGACMKLVGGKVIIDE